MQILNGSLTGVLTGAKCRYAEFEEMENLIGEEITIVIEEKNDHLIDSIITDKIFNEANLVIRIKPIIK
jgi:hypothetical protein